MTKIKPGDRVRIIFKGDEGFEGTVTFSISKPKGYLKVLITEVGNQGGYWIGKVLSYYEDELEPIDTEPKEVDLLKTKIKDVIAHRHREGRQAMVWKKYLETDTVPTNTSDIRYLDMVWNNIPEKYKAVSNHKTHTDLYQSVLDNIPWFV